MAVMTTIAAGPALADDASTSAALSKIASQTEGTAVYFGNGCFWGRQKQFFDIETSSLGRNNQTVSATVGYAGGAQAGKDGKVCYYYAPSDTVYEKLGHAEVVGLSLSSGAEEAQFRAFAKEYFTQFQETPFGMIRLDPQDMGAGYRNVIGIPGGVSNTKFMNILGEENTKGMALLPGEGDRGKETDKVNTIWVMDIDKFPFYQAEVYHQFHNGIGKAFPEEYRVGVKKAALQRGLIGSTGCPDEL